MKIVIPKLSTANALDFCESLHREEVGNSYCFDVSNINNYEPLPMLLTSAAIRQFCDQRNLRPQDIQLCYEDNSDYTYACHMGYFQAAGFPQGKAPGEAYGSPTYIPLTKLNIQDMQVEFARSGRYYNQGDLIETKSDELAKILSQDNTELQKLLRYLIREAIRNVPEHAGTNEVWLCGQYWHNRDIAEIAILDEGMGVFKSIKRNHIYKQFIDNNIDALRWVLKPGVSVKFDPVRRQRNGDIWANSGYGLYMISEICKATRGWFTFVSGQSCLRVYTNTVSVCPTYFNGTALGIRIKPSLVKNGQAIIDFVRKSGEGTAKSIKNAFKSASRPSRGLIDIF